MMLFGAMVGCALTDEQNSAYRVKDNNQEMSSMLSQLTT